MDSPREDLIRLLALTAHELRTPLSVVSGYLKMLSGERMGPLTDAQRKAVTAAGKACQQLIALASDLSAVGRLDRGETTLSPAPTLAAALIADSVAACVTSDYPVTLEAAGGDDVPIVVDAVRTRQSLQTVIMTVVRAAPDGATVRVSHAVHDDDAGRRRLVILVADAGRDHAGAADRALEVDRLGPVDEWTGGLGIALPLARRLLRLQGGDIHALEPGRPGLVVTLPVAAGPVAGGPVAAGADGERP